MNHELEICWQEFRNLLEWLVTWHPMEFSWYVPDLYSYFITFDLDKEPKWTVLIGLREQLYDLEEKEELEAKYRELEAEYREEFWIACEELHKHVMETDVTSLNGQRASLDLQN